MERNIYTFKELIEKYHWDIQDKRLSTNDRKIAFACQNGVLIEPTQEQRQKERTFWIADIFCWFFGHNGTYVNIGIWKSHFFLLLL